MVVASAMQAERMSSFSSRIARRQRDEVPAIKTGIIFGGVKKKKTLNNRFPRSSVLDLQRGFVKGERKPFLRANRRYSASGISSCEKRETELIAETNEDEKVNKSRIQNEQKKKKRAED
jgi:hypothetical protein